MNTVKINVDYLADLALNWAVAKAEGEEVRLIKGQLETLWTENGWKPSTDWAQGGPIVEREKIELVPQSDAMWDAMKRGQHIPNEGPTPLIAAMRCYVASKLGDIVEVPRELYKEDV